MGCQVRVRVIAPVVVVATISVIGGMTTTTRAPRMPTPTLLPPVVPVEVVEMPAGVRVPELGIAFDAFDGGYEFDGV